MDYKLVEPSLDLTSSSNWITLLKFWGVNIVISIVVVLMIVFIFYVFIVGGASVRSNVDDNELKGAIAGAVDGSILSLLPIVLVVLMGQMYTLSWFEQLDGCYKKTT